MKALNADAIVGVVGLGLMGKSITACLLAAGHTVVAHDSEASRRSEAPRAIAEMLGELAAEGSLRRPVAEVLARLRVAEALADLSGARVVFEVITEDMTAKRTVFSQLEDVLPPDAIIASNTSAIPISLLQKGLRHPERLIGVHWAEPAHLTRFLEIIAGEQTDEAIGPQLHSLASLWGKEPSLVRRDIRGFVANRIMYAMIREAFHLVEAGVASVEDVDRSVRNDVGSWATLAGPFRWMDLTGIPAYASVMDELMPELSTATTVPRLMQEVVASGALGTANARGFHHYTPESARAWDDAFRRFSMEIRHLQHKFPETPGDPGTSQFVPISGEGK
jgi:3-hydroxybutyryl-CoA dehydrogenase